MRFDGGWVKIHRSILTGDLQGDGYAMAIFIKLIIWANHAPTRHKGKIVPRGSLMTGLGELEESTGFSRPTICRRLKLLQDYQMITRYVKRSGSLITICNYDKYQCINNEQGEVSETIEKRLRNDRETIEKRSSTHIEELKNSRREEFKKTNSCVPPSGDEPVSKKRALVPIEDPAILAIASNWYKFAQQEMPWKKEGGEWCLQGFARSLVKVAKATDLNQAGVEALFKFIENDEFWRKNAVSPNGLLTKSKNGSRKIDNILNRMKPPEDLVKKALLEYANSEEPIENPFDKWARDVREKRRS